VIAELRLIFVNFGRAPPAIEAGFGFGMIHSLPDRQRFGIFSQIP